MKPYRRRDAQAYPYYKLAVWDARDLTWRDGKRAYPTEFDARAAALRPGLYRVSIVTDSSRHDLDPFEVRATFVGY